MSELSQALGALKTLSEQIYEQQLRSEERLKAQHGRFNVFTTLLKAHDEVRLHTRFIHELLNPEGTHDCGDLFLKLFFETLKEDQALKHNNVRSKEPWEDYSEQRFWAGKEVRKDQGQLDLLLESDSHVLIIENKIWASEGDEQVARYCQYLESQKPKTGQVLYLTLDGKQAETHNNKAYLRISYREHIMAWLERCLQATYHIVPINQVIIQYQRLVKQLTGQQFEAKTMETIKDFIRHNPVIIKDNPLVSKAIKELHIEVLNRFAQAITESLKQDFSVRYRQHMKNENFGEEGNRGLVVEPLKSFYKADHTFEIWIEHNPWWGWAIGIETAYKKDQPISDEELNLLKRIYPRLAKVYHDANEHYSDATKTWNGTHWPCSWHNIIRNFMYGGEAISLMFNPIHFAEQVELTNQDVRTFVSRFKEIYLEEVTHMQGSQKQ